ncbi:MAG: 1-acyl-sn-glycerol-3-phosphate acyltransferase [Chlamydiales bacterium]|jgi:1-acyl-sn-glycerol-3-phosphate acyltransferase
MFWSKVVRFIVRPLSKLTLRLAGWKAFPVAADMKKGIGILGPHTSTWDLLVGVNIVLASNSPLKWVGKKELFRAPFGSMLQAFGGIPLDREAARGTVDKVVSLFEQKDEFIYGISPEGTRKKTEYWRSGFYHIALKAKVPLLFFYMDYGKKEGGYGGHFMPTGDQEKDLETIKQFYSKITPKNPECFSPIRFK